MTPRAPRGPLRRESVCSRPDAAGFEIVEKVSHSIEPVDPDPRTARAARRSRRSSRARSRAAFFGRLGSSGLFRQALAGGRVAAVGEATGGRPCRARLAPTSSPADPARASSTRCPRRLDGWRVLLPRGEDATAELPEGLRAAGAHASPGRHLPQGPAVRRSGASTREIAEGSFAAFCATSPSAAHWLFAATPKRRRGRLRATPAVVLGRFTRRYLESHGVARIECARRRASRPSRGSAELALRRARRGIDSPP